MSNVKLNTLEALNSAYEILRPWSETHEHEKRYNEIVLSLIEEYFPEKDIKIIDLGCGIGTLLVALQQLGYGNVEGIERHVLRDEETQMFKVANPEVLKSAWEKLGINVQDMDLYDMPYKMPKHEYDLVISSAVIEHLKDPKSFLSNINSVLRKGGAVITMSPNLSVFYKRLRFFFGFSPNWDIRDFFGLGEKGFVGHWREYTLGELKKMHEWAGFEILKAFNTDIFELLKKRTLRNIFHIVLRYASLFIPNSREANIIIAKKI